MKTTKILTLSALSLMLVGVGLFSTFKINTVSTNEALEEKAAPSTYYNNVDTTSKTTLYSSLRTIINTGVTTCSYSNLVEKLRITDWDENGLDDSSKKGRIVDMYSNTTKYGKNDNGGSYSKEGDCWNKEHLIPKNWWGGNDNGTGKGEGGDAFNMFPTDGKINGMRSNYAFGEVSSASSQSNNGFCKLGSSKVSGYSGTVFEPNDKYKGDIARAYFYFATKNQNANGTGGSSYNTSYGSVLFASSKQFMLTDYASKLFYSWHKLDPVSDWEKQRCDQVYNQQHNRNPYIDHPEWADIIWGDGQITEVKVTSVSLNKSSTSLVKGNTETLTATVLPSNATKKTLSWTTSNSAVATVNNGVVTAVGAGNCTITASSTDGSNKSSTCTVTVTDPSPSVVNVTSVSLNKTAHEMYVGDTTTLIPTVLPENATNKNVTWSSSEPTIASVNNGTINALKSGTSVITATTVDGNKTASCTVTVKENTETIYISKINADTLLSIDKGTNKTISYTLEPAEPSNKKISFVSSDTSIATVDENGLVTGVNPGQCVITLSATDGSGVTAKTNITVNEAVKPSSGCSGSVIATSAVLSTISLLGAALLIVKKKQK